MNEIDKIKSDMICFGSGFALETVDGLKHIPLKEIYKMPNTTVTVTYANGATREFIASDELEKLINDGDMFSITTMHSDMGIDEEMSVSKMYVGNPVSAMGSMMMMKRNAEKLLNEENDKDMNIVIETLTACIQLMSNEITSHQSGMSPVKKHFFCGFEDTNNVCTASCNKDEPCIKDVKCEGFMPF